MERTDDQPRYDGVLTPWLRVRDLEKSLAWYRDVLGLRLAYRLESAGWCELDTSIARVAVGLHQADPVPQAGGATLTFGVRDLHAERARLEQLQVRFDGPTHEIPGVIRMASFQDPDGNPLMFCEVLGEHRHAPVQISDGEVRPCPSPDPS